MIDEALKFQFTQEEIDILHESLRRRRFYALAAENKSDKEVFEHVAKIDSLIARLKPSYLPKDWSAQLLKDEAVLKK